MNFRRSRVTVMYQQVGGAVSVAASNLQQEDEEEGQDQEEVSSLLASPGGPGAGREGGRCFPCLAANRQSPSKTNRLFFSD